MRSERLSPPCLLALAALGLLAGCAQTPTHTARDGNLAALLGTPSPTAFAAAPAVTAAEALAKGDAALVAGDPDRALFEYLRALRQDEGNAEILYKVGAIQASRHNNGVAEAAYRRALDSDPKQAGALTGLGILLTRQRQYAEAETLLRTAVRADPKLAGAHNALGVLADIERDHARAQGHFLDGLAHAPQSPTLHNNLGYSHYLAGNNQAAITEFRAALALDPNYARAWRNLGLVYSRQGKYEKALAAFRKVQDLPQAYNDVGYIAMVAGRLDDAQSFFEEAQRLSPEYYPTASDNAQRVRALRKK